MDPTKLLGLKKEGKEEDEFAVRDEDDNEEEEECEMKKEKARPEATAGIE